MKFLNYDLFSSEFYFNIEGQQKKRGTIPGFTLSLIAATTIVSYFFYLLYLYVNNQIDPKFRSQSFIVDERIDVSLTQDLVGFKFAYNSTMSIDTYQILQNKTFIVYVIQFFQYDNNATEMLYLDVIQCTNPQLQGFNCIDFSKANNYTLAFDNNNNIFSQLQINIYGCRDLDNIKTTVPNNCAAQSEINDVIDQINIFKRRHWAIYLNFYRNG
ncbi:transmembrane protein, putative (macronuclear) [Tetrahymena thermophila SB210]|uniref:Transmembrane protein, putative n=1 Tax=Tetrahymena thermophila (strain SB210) TaxID=312017 RepID=W7X6P9_TETTS|nr:transmembrane protein, putative [Tetrahymena thermophila SB210]EWS73052.1 transmembrane protein, putative [Tetrahymena thermophila SB210]|eukprot:XP_012654449.1 transmembrane protein, putative [Tetrahymena thermophila SB210]